MDQKLSAYRRPISIFEKCQIAIMTGVGIGVGIGFLIEYLA